LRRRRAYPLAGLIALTSLEAPSFRFWPRPGSQVTPGRMKRPDITRMDVSYRRPTEVETDAEQTLSHQDKAADFSFDKARILTRTLAGLAAPGVISPVEGLRTSVPAFRAGTFRSVTFNRPGQVNSPTPRG
jgi:hypothetical protein